MMTVRSMTATFGRLNGAKLSCAEGLNLIHAPNEGGKSTWCAFYKAMLFGLDTRDRDKKGHLAAKNRYQPWSGAPMEGEMVVEFEGRTVIIRRFQKGSTPFGGFSALYADSGQPVPGMTGSTCGEMLTGVSQEVFERSAFIGGDAMAVTPAPDLERRITALLTAGQEDVSYSQVQERLKGWLNRRRVNRTVGLIPKLEGELAQVRADLARAEEHAAQLSRLERGCADLRRQRAALEGELDIHLRLAQKQLNARFAAAEEEYQSARSQLDRLEREFRRFGQLPPKEELKKMQFELQYLRVLDEEIRAAQTALEQAEEDYIQAQIAAQNDRFPGLSGEEARRAVTADQLQHKTLTDRAARTKKWFIPLLILGLLALCAGVGADFYLYGGIRLFAPVGAGCLLLALCAGLLLRARAKKLLSRGAEIPKKYAAASMEEVEQLTAAYESDCAAAQLCADRCKAVRGELNDLKARKENSRTDIFDFVHTFAPEVKELFGCSAAISRALTLDHDRAAAAERLEQRRLRRDDLQAQGGQPFQTLELLHPPARSEEETRTALAQVTARLTDGELALQNALGRQQELGDPAALFARKEELERELTARFNEQKAILVAMEALDGANEALQRRFSPQLNALTAGYFARLTGETYDRVSLDRELEAQVAQTGAILPRTALYLSRGAADQLYLAVRLAVCALCLPQKPPIVLDDALVCFDDTRLKWALELLEELAQEQQILLFTCQKREAAVLEGST